MSLLNCTIETNSPSRNSNNALPVLSNIDFRTCKISCQYYDCNPTQHNFEKTSWAPSRMAGFLKNPNHEEFHNCTSWVRWPCTLCLDTQYNLNPKAQARGMWHPLKRKKSEKLPDHLQGELFCSKHHTTKRFYNCTSSVRWPTPFASNPLNLKREELWHLLRTENLPQSSETTSARLPDHQGELFFLQTPNDRGFIIALAQKVTYIICLHTRLTLNPERCEPLLSSKTENLL